jgi:signal transduction histidine kinase
MILIYIVFEDDIKRLTRENKELNNQIDKSRVFVNIGENVSGLVHNLNGDLGIISMAVSILEESVDDPSIKYITDSNKRLQSKVRNILTLAKYSQIEDDTEFNMNSLLYSLLDVFKINHDYKRIKVVTDFQSEDFFYGNASEISQIFENIIKNACEALLEKWSLNVENKNISFIPQLVVSVSRDQEFNRITFTDNGPGIKSCIDSGCNKDCGKCSRFRIGKTTKKDGTGLGLVSVGRTLEKYKGAIEIKTELTGTSITIKLPL